METIIDQIKDYVLEPNEEITDVEAFYNIEQDYVVKFKIDDNEYLIMIDQL